MECYYRMDWYIEMDTQPYGFCPILTMDYGNITWIVEIETENPNKLIL